MLETPDGSRLTVCRAAPSPPRFEPSRFECSLSYGSLQSAWVRVAGELDLATVPQLELTVRRAERNARLIVLDLRELTFIDAAGLHGLVQADARARLAGDRLVVVNGPPQIRRLLGLTRLTRLLEIVEDPERLTDDGAPATLSAPRSPARAS